MKNQTISADASGPARSVWEPLGLPPDQACPAPCNIQLSIQVCPCVSACTEIREPGMGPDTGKQLRVGLSQHHGHRGAR